MEYYWLYGVLLLFAGLGLAALEVFFPSGGVLGFLSFASMVGGITLGFMHSATAGVLIISMAIVGLPITLVTALTVLPKTRFGKRFILLQPSSDEVLPEDPQLEARKQLVGRIGYAKSKMLPAGAITIDGQTIDAVSDGFAVEPGQPVRVLEVTGNRMVVTPIEPEEAVDQSQESLLDRPIESVGLEPFDEEDENTSS